MLEFARKSNKKGEIAQWVRRKRDRLQSLLNLQDFANRCEMDGEKLIGVEMVSVFNDRYFGQWLALRAPFRKLDDLISPEVADKVPEEYRHVGSATLKCPAHWADEAAELAGQCVAAASLADIGRAGSSDARDWRLARKQGAKAAVAKAVAARNARGV